MAEVKKMYRDGSRGWETVEWAASRIEGYLLPRYLPRLRLRLCLQKSQPEPRLSRPTISLHICPTSPTLQQGIVITRFLVSLSRYLLHTSAAEDDKTGLNVLRGARCAVLRLKKPS